MKTMATEFFALKTHLKINKLYLTKADLKCSSNTVQVTLIAVITTE